MKNRVSTYPGRILLTPVEGETNKYDMQRADEPVEVGDPLSSETFLKSSTADSYHLSLENPLPDDIFQKLSSCLLYDSANKQFKAMDGTVIGNYPGAQIATGSYVGNGNYGSGHPNTLVLPFEFKFIILQRDATIDSSFESATVGGEITMLPGFSSTYYTQLSSAEFNVTVSGNTIQWYCNSSTSYYNSADYQFNKSRTTYRYIAVG